MVFPLASGMIRGVGRSFSMLGFVGYFSSLSNRREEWGSLEPGWGVFRCGNSGGGGLCSSGNQTY